MRIISSAKKLLITSLILFPLSCSHISVPDDEMGVFAYVQNESDGTSRFDIDKLDHVSASKLTNYVNQLSKSISILIKIEIVPVYVVDITEAQATASFGDHSIYVSKGMLFAIKTESELVAVIAHEIGHFALKHDTEYKESTGFKVAKEMVEGATGAEIPSAAEDLIERIKLSQFSKGKERAADEFGALQAHRLGYNPYDFANLLERLNGMADRNVLARLAGLIGSHETLLQRAEHLRSYLKDKLIQPEGRQNADSYLSVVGQVFSGHKRSENENLKADKQLKVLQIFLRQRIQKSQRLTPEEFLRSMDELRAIAKKLNFLNELPHEKNRLIGENEFMMELVRVLRPWWWGTDQQLQETLDILSKFGRVGVGLVPYVGQGISFYEFVSGSNFFTGKELTFGERVASGLGAAASASKYFKESTGGIGKFQFPNGLATKEAQSTGKAVQEAADGSPIFKDSMAENKGDKLRDLESKYRPIKNEENYEKLKELNEKLKDKNIPDDWPSKVTKVKPAEEKFQGLDFSHPENPEVRVRVMPGHSNTPFPTSQEPYVVQRVGDKAIDRLGNAVKPNASEAHIPLKEYQFTKFWEKHVKAK
jgi:hypothetical protein